MAAEKQQLYKGQTLDSLKNMDVRELGGLIQNQYEEEAEELLRMLDMR